MKSLIIRCDVKMGYYNNLEFIIGTIVIIIFTIYQTIKQYKENKRIKNANKKIEKDTDSILFHNNNKVKYVGNISDNQYDGYGKLYFENGDIYYKGYFKKGKFDGRGSEYSYGGELIYEGEFSKGKYQGKGKQYGRFLYSGLVYEGEFKNDFKDGYGIEYHKGRITYEGMFEEDEKNGFGKLYKYNKSTGTNELVYEGEFKDGKPILKD